MRPFIFYPLTFVLAFIIAFFGWQKFNIPKEPVIQVEPQTYDFGDVKKATYSASFVVKNTGGGALKIEGILPSCGCIQTSISQNEIKGGEAADLKISVDFSDHSKGPVEAAVYLKNNDPKNKEVNIETKGNLIE